jgi:hypothetical protein
MSSLFFCCSYLQDFLSHHLTERVILPGIRSHATALSPSVLYAGAGSLSPAPRHSLFLLLLLLLLLQ